MSRRPRPAPVALTSDGTLLVHYRELRSPPDPVEAVRHLLTDGHRVWIGVEVSDGRSTRRVIADAALNLVVESSGRLSDRSG